MKKIQLTKGRYALVDDEDYEYLNQWNWQYKDHPSYSGYAIRFEMRDGHNKSFRMHRVLMDTPEGMDCDHKNGDGLDNQKSNLRNCTHQENQRNRKRNKGITGYKGVYSENRGNRKPWTSQITVNGKTIRIGGFDNPHHAAMAYDIWAKDIYGEFAVTNFK